MRGWILGLAALVAAGGAQGQKSYHFKARMHTQMDLRSEDARMEGWMVGAQRFRIDTYSPKGAVVSIGANGELWNLDPATLTATHRKQTAAERASLAARPRAMGDELSGMLKRGAKRRAVEQLEGVRCDVYSLKTRDGMVHTLWVQQGPEHLTKRYQVVGSAAFSGGPGGAMQPHTLMRMVTYTWEVGKPIAPSRFKLPPGYRVAEAPPPGAPVYAPPTRATKQPGRGSKRKSG